MNESKEKTMTISELALFLGKSISTIRRACKELNYIFENGITRRFNRNEVQAISEKLFTHVPFAVKESIKTTFSNEQGQPLSNDDLVTKSDLIDFGKTIVSEMFKQLVPMIQNNQPKQIEVKQDYYSILGYMKYKNIDEAVFSEMICYGKEASKISRDLNKEIRKIPDERFGTVNSYHIAVLEKVFEI